MTFSNLKVYYHHLQYIVFYFSLVYAVIVNSKENCLTWPLDNRNVILIGETHDQRLLLLDDHYQGYLFNISALANQNGTGQPSVDMMSAGQPTSVKVSLPPRKTGKGVYIFIRYYGVYPFQTRVHIVSADASNITSVLLEDDHDIMKTFSLLIKASADGPPLSDVFLSQAGADFEEKVIVQQNDGYFVDARYEQDSFKSLIEGNSDGQIHFALSHPIDGGFIWASCHLYAFNNKQSMIRVWTIPANRRSADKLKPLYEVPYTQFFACPGPDAVFDGKVVGLVFLLVVMSLLVLTIYCLCAQKAARSMMMLKTGHYKLKMKNKAAFKGASPVSPRKRPVKLTMSPASAKLKAILKSPVSNSSANTSISMNASTSKRSTSPITSYN